MSVQTIRVEFVNAQDNQVFATADVPVSQLPQSFEQATTMHLGSDDWQVVKAEPLTAAEFQKTGKLRLTLSKVESVNPKDILYSLPTICDEIPATFPGSVAKEPVFRIHEDEWQQVEFVSTKYTDHIRTQLEAIAGIYQNHRVGAGFNHIHVRQPVSPPVASNPALRQIRAYFPADARQYQSVSYPDSKEMIPDSFAWEVAPFIVYGHGDGVDTLALHYIKNPATITPDTVERLYHLMGDHDLMLVDWVRVGAIPASMEALQNYFGRFK